MIQSEVFGIIEDSINQNINSQESFNNEKEFRRWFKGNYKFLGFKKIIKERGSKFPDFLMLLGEEEIEVELETISSHFILHKHNPSLVDLVICITKDKELPVKTLYIPFFECNVGMTTIAVQEKTKERFDIFQFEHNKELKSQDDVINYLLDHYIDKNET